MACAKERRPCFLVAEGVGIPAAGGGFLPPFGGAPEAGLAAVYGAGASSTRAWGASSASVTAMEPSAGSTLSPGGVKRAA